MERWNPKSYYDEGSSKGYPEDYLNALVDKGKQISSCELPVIYSLSHLANCSRTLYRDLYEIVARAEHAVPYKNFPISKRSGGKRWISIPSPQLMAVQSYIATEILRKIPPHRRAKAYVPGLKNPLVEHASVHLGAKWILKMDISNFFSNISEKQVYAVFKNSGYPNLLAFEMARLCTRVTPRRKGARWKQIVKPGSTAPYQCSKVGSLPQGAPTSPALSNLVCIELDTQLDDLANSSGADYSRYADDLCFSFGESTRLEVSEFMKKVAHVLYSHSFNVNRKKTRIIPPGARKIVTGIVIDAGKTTIPRELRNKLRAHLYNSKRFGIPKYCEILGFRSVIGFRNHLYGLICFVRSVNSDQGLRFMQEFNELPWLDFKI